MFSESEKERLTKYAYSFPRHELEDFLYEDEIETIESTGELVARNLQNRIFIPQHNWTFQTIRLQHLFTKLDVEKWILGMTDCLDFGRIIAINIGFSYLVCKPPEKLRYVYAAKALSFERTKVSTVEELHEFAARFSKLNDPDYLLGSFMSSLRGNVFEVSGFIPQTLVCAYCWISK